MNRAVGLLLLVSLSGCASLVGSSHNAGLVEELGLEQVEQDMVRIGRQATSPEVTDVQLHDGWFSLRGGFNFYKKLDIYYENLARLDLYSDGGVWLQGADRILGRLYFDSVALAQRWCNLVVSLKAYHHEKTSLAPGDDAFEENDTRWQATPLELGSYEGLRVQDLDWYAVVLAPGDTLNVRVQAEPASHDLELTLFDEAGEQLVTTQATHGVAAIRYQSRQDGPVYLRVGSSQGGATYTLELR